MPVSPPISAEAAVARVRRDYVLGMFVRVLLLTGLFVAVIASVVSRRDLLVGSGGIIFVVLWMIASMRSVKCHRLLARVGPLLELKRHDEAEQTLAEVFSTFSLNRQPKRIALQNLAALRHAQQRYQDAGYLAAALLDQPSRDANNRRTLQLMLGECALELNDLRTAHNALSQISPTGMPVRETLKLLELQVDYCVRISAWQQAIEQLPLKIELAELMPTDTAARVQALLAVATQKLGRPDWAAWLKRRVELLVDPKTLLERRPVLREVFDTPPLA